MEIADLFRLSGPQYRAQCGARMLPRHLRAMPDIERCRTAPLGSQVYDCETCQASHDRDHSCQNRHGPTRQQDHAQPWLAQQQRLLLPVPHCMVPCTLPAALRGLARRHQKSLDPLRLRSAAEALQALA